MYSITTATPGDIPALVRLINSGYRGEGSKKGWTSEADLLKGPIRTDEESLSSILQNENACMLKCTAPSGEIEGCVFLEKRMEGLYLGMLTVSPEKQGSGIGKLLLHAADEHARHTGCNVVFMTVFTVRHELIAWYERHGYRQTARRKPYTDDEKFGVATQPLEFVVLEKKLEL